MKYDEDDQKNSMGKSNNDTGELDDLQVPSFMQKEIKKDGNMPKQDDAVFSQHGLLDDVSENNLTDESGYQTQKSKEDFKLKIDDIKSIPDYVAVHKVKKGTYRAGVFAKVMFGLIIVCLSVGLALVIIFGAQDVLGMGKADNTALVEVKQNEGLSQVAETLEEKGVINSAFLFKLYYKFSKADTDFQYGTYSLKSNMSYDTILSELEKYSSSKEEVQIMFKEGSTIYQIADLLQKNKVCSSAEFIEAVEKTDFGFDFEKNIGENELRFHKLEGYLFPDTYKFFVGDSPVNVTKKFLSNYDKKVSEKMLIGAPSISMSQEDVITVASIVQLEAGKIEEMKKVASVYLNRIKNPGEYAKLQADPTRDYANELKLQMSVIDQKIIDAYNTYEGTGLPPGPICNPGVDAIDAVLNADKTDYFYFCTDSKTGEFYYAQTLEEHNKNVKKAGLRQN